MGEVKKFMEASRMIQCDFAAPDVYIPEAELSDKPEEIKARAVKILIAALLDAKYPQGAGRDEGVKAAAWYEVLNNKDMLTVSMPKLLTDWLEEIAADRKLAINWRLAQWREALVDYFKALGAAEEPPCEP